jgi:hypothetical protein
VSQRNKLKGMVGKGGTPEDVVTTPVATASADLAVTAVGPDHERPGRHAARPERRL